MPALSAMGWNCPVRLSFKRCVRAEQEVAAAERHTAGNALCRQAVHFCCSTAQFSFLRKEVHGAVLPGGNGIYLWAAAAVGWNCFTCPCFQEAHCSLTGNRLQQKQHTCCMMWCRPHAFLLQLLLSSACCLKISARSGSICSVHFCLRETLCKVGPGRIAAKAHACAIAVFPIRLCRRRVVQSHLAVAAVSVDWI